MEWLTAAASQTFRFSNAYSQDIHIVLDWNKHFYIPKYIIWTLKFHVHVYIYLWSSFLGCNYVLHAQKLPSIQTMNLIAASYDTLLVFDENLKLHSKEYYSNVIVHTHNVHLAFIQACHCWPGSCKYSYYKIYNN